MQEPSVGESISAKPSPSAAPRLRVAIGVVVLLWITPLVLRGFDMGMFARFLVQLGVCFLATLTFIVWWLFQRRVSRSERWLAFAALLGGAIGSKLLLHPSVIVPAWLFLGLPSVFTAWTLWLLAARKAGPRTHRLGLVAVIFAVWGVFLFIRMDGLDGEGEYALYWRWSLTEEEKFRAERSQRQKADPGSEPKLELQAGDWPAFRGPKGDSVYHGATIATDWAASPPKQRWRFRVGPAWSSVIVVANLLFTQEQRDQSEAVVCFDALTGKEIWVHEDKARFEENQAGAGPRATPAFAGGYLYTFGGTGLLNCLEASTGKSKWQRDVVADSRSEVPMWGFASSPVVAQGLVVVYAGGQSSGQLLAYRADTGEPAWTAPAGKMGYATAHFAVIGGEPQFLFLGDRGLTSYEPKSGGILWEYKSPGGPPALPRSLQPQIIGDSQVLIEGEDFGATLLDVKRAGESWKVEKRWTSRAMKPSYNDFVVHEGSIYGFDGGIFCCIDLKTGEQLWKEGRYGKGQVALLADQSLLLVLAEDGKMVLLKATPQEHEEIGKFQAIKGKTWNHPVIVGRRLYVRNASEMACYDFGVPEKK